MNISFSLARPALTLGLCFSLIGGASAQPQIVPSGGEVSLAVPTTDSKVRLRVRNGMGYPAEETKSRENNRFSARLEADPGLYQIRARTNNKARTDMGVSLDVVVPGLRREAGAWLFNGSIWIPRSTSDAPATLLANLKRGDKDKLPLNAATPGLLGWNTTRFTGNNSTGGPSVGYLVNVLDASPRPGDGPSARLLEANASDALSAHLLDANAKIYDAVVLKFDANAPFEKQLWPLKIARRNAEETKDYDLPIFADVSEGTFTPSQLLEIYQGGATGFIAAPDAPTPDWARVWNQNSNWLLGAVTLEDMGVLPTRASDYRRLLSSLRQAERIPLLGRLPNEDNSKGEAIMTLLDDATNTADLDGFKTAASAGNTLYLEGLPSPSLYAKMGEITGTQVETLAAPREDLLTLDDPWLWGAIRGMELPVTRKVALTAKKSLAAQTKEQKGMSLETTPRASGKTTGDANGWMVCPVGKGRIFWMPHPLRDTTSANLPAYYSAVSGAMQAALVSLNGDTNQVRFALRQTPGNTALLAIFNDGDKPAQLQVSARGDAALVSDLMSGKTVASKVSGFASQFEITVPAHDFRWLALAKSENDWNKERETKRAKVRLR